jgi:type I restriction enzyme R subunit
MLCLEDLFIFLDFVACCYGKEYTEGKFDPTLVSKHSEPVVEIHRDPDFDRIMAENEALKAELTARRAEQQQTYVPKPLDLSEYKTRKIYIDAMLMDAGWTEGKDWINEVELPGMPNRSEVGYADYVLYDDSHKPLAVIEAKRSSKDPNTGRKQAVLYADCLERRFGRRPMMFTSNGFETYFWDDQTAPQRRVSGFFSRDDLQKLMNRRTERRPWTRWRLTTKSPTATTRRRPSGPSAPVWSGACGKICWSWPRAPAKPAPPPASRTC